MERDEVARRLESIRERVREHLREEVRSRLPNDLPETEPAALEPHEFTPLPRTPNLNTTQFLEDCNRGAEITAPIDLTSRVPVVGRLLTLLRRLARPFVQPILDPYLDRQERFNASLVRHLNELGQRLERRLGRIQDVLESWADDPTELEGRLDSALAGYDAALRHRQAILFDALEEELVAIENAARDLASDNAARIEEVWVRLVERSQAVDRRFEEKDAALEAALRAGMRGETYAELMGLRRQLRETVEKLQLEVRGPDPADADDGGGGEESERVPPAPAVTEGRGLAGVHDGLDASFADDDYRAFQAAFRGDPAEITRRLRDHVRGFEGAPGPIADLGCGRGEFLDLLSEAGHDTVGVEINAADVETCSARGLAAVEADIFDWLGAREEGTLGGIFMAHVIEHLLPRDWARFVDLAASRLAPGGRMVVETINPESLYALVRAYVLDPTHVRPVHPKLLSFFAQRAGFHPVEVRMLAEVPEDERPVGLSEALAGGHADLRTLIYGLNERLARIDKLCCAPQEYALYATLPDAPGSDE